MLFWTTAVLETSPWQCLPACKRADGEASRVYIRSKGGIACRTGSKLSWRPNPYHHLHLLMHKQ